MVVGNLFLRMPKQPQIGSRFLESCYREVGTIFLRMPKQRQIGSRFLESCYREVYAMNSEIKNEQTCYQNCLADSSGESPLSMTMKYSGMAYKRNEPCVNIFDEKNSL
ncbi:hypothetical protein CRYUN_Cryun01aG0012900 [Craigia yunnanensis]